ncbi:MAG: hypothetical protein IPI01_03345 [Ignavibacteriae bacterium]|nr:hypothetical protein [Ignavibacteriota bacterium]
MRFRSAAAATAFFSLSAMSRRRLASVMARSNLPSDTNARINPLSAARFHSVVPTFS